MDNSNRVYGYWRVVMWGGAAVLLSLPALAMRFFPDAGVNWTREDFLVMTVMLLVACMAIEIGARVSNSLPYRAGVIVAVGTGFVTFWVNGAVGMIQDEGNPANLVFLAVLGIAVAGALAARLAAPGMAMTMLAAGGAQAMIALYVAVAGLDTGYTAMLIGLFTLPWLLSAGLFHLAGRRQGLAHG
jgi:hypothetical protein